MRKRAMLMVGCLAGGLVALAPGGPAGAAVTVTSSGTVVSASVTGITTVRFTCVSGAIRVSNVPATPSVACTAVTRVNVSGDSAGQIVFGDDLDTGFPALTSTSFLTGGGSDLVWATRVDDLVFTATGQDQVFAPAAGTDDTLLQAGSDSEDVVHLAGTTGDDDVVIATDGSGTTAANLAWNADITTRFLDVAVLAGNDDVDATGVTDTLVSFAAYGGDGNDVLRGGQPPSTLDGGSGTNTLAGGPGVDRLNSYGPNDTVRSMGGADLLRDAGEARIGGRTLENPAGPDDQWALSVAGDVAIRSRATSATASSVTGAISRTGRQDLGPTVGELTYDTVGGPADRALLDLAALPGHPQRVLNSPGTVVDLVVPTGSWSIASGTVTFTGGYQPVIVGGPAPHVRAPFTDPNQRFGHRLIRDLEVRIPTAVERDSIRDQLAGGTRTRAQIVNTFTATDVYRGIDVDRAFVDILRRANDPAGRAYWIERLRDGLHLRKLRANLYGSLEYYNGFGDGDDTTYVASAYRDILGRPSDPAGLAYWVDLIESGTPKGTVAERFLNTPEARAVLIRDRFLRWVDREPTAGELSTWSSAVASTTSDGEQALIRFLAASAAYYTRPDV